MANSNMINECILVSVDFTNGKDNSVLIVGRQKPGKAVEIINAFQGQEAEDLYYKLITQVKKEDRNG